MRPTTKLATSKTPDGAELTLTGHDGNFFLNVGGVPLMNTRAFSSEQQMAELACKDIRTANPRILIGGLGFGFTLARVLELVPKKATVEVVELLPIIVEWNRTYLSEVNGKMLDDPRTEIVETDVYDIIRDAHSKPYDAILLDTDNGAEPLVGEGNRRLYSSRGLRMVRNALAPGGRVVFWSAARDKPFAKSLAAVFDTVDSVGAKAYPQAKRFTHSLFVADRD